LRCPTWPAQLILLVVPRCSPRCADPAALLKWIAVK
jgi:hypothetical protein